MIHLILLISVVCPSGQKAENQQQWPYTKENFDRAKKEYDRAMDDIGHGTRQVAVTLETTEECVVHGVRAGHRRVKK